MAVNSRVRRGGNGCSVETKHIAEDLEDSPAMSVKSLACGFSDLLHNPKGDFCPEYEDCPQNADCVSAAYAYGEIWRMRCEPVSVFCLPLNYGAAREFVLPGYKESSVLRLGRT